MPRRQCAYEFEQAAHSNDVIEEEMSFGDRVAMRRTVRRLWSS